MIMALVPIRQYIMPRLFSRQTLHALDAAEYEAAPPVDQQEAFREATPLELAELVCASNCGTNRVYHHHVAQNVHCFGALRLLC